MKRGLVLAGGGAKGAYAFGAIRALLQNGLAFDAVAGTSVGALNAALLALDAMDEGERIWTTISRDNVYPVRRLKLWRAFRRIEPLMKRLLRPLSIAYGLALSAMSGVPTPGERVLRVIAGMIMLLPAIIATWWVVGSGAAMWAGILSMTILVLVQVLAGHRRTSADFTLVLSTFPYAVGLTGALLFVLGSLAAAVGLDTRTLEEGSALEQAVGVAAQLLTLAIGGVFLLIAALSVTATVQALSKRAEKSLGSYMSSAPLAETLRKLLEEHRFRIPCFATVASKATYWDPDRSGWTATAHSAGLVPSPWSMVEYDPDVKTDWAGQYVDVSKTDVSTAADLLLASAALPYGLVDPVRVGDQIFVDGGVFDNVPAFPLMGLELDEVWVILLAPLDSVDDLERAIGVDELTWQRKERFLRVVQHPIPDKVSGRLHDTRPPTEPIPAHTDPVTIPNRKRPRLPPVRIVAPRPIRFRGLRTAFRLVTRNPLGGLRKGTLNFRATYAKAVMRLGEEDAMAAIASAGTSHGA